MEFHGHRDSSEVLTSLTWLLKFWPETSSFRSWDVIAIESEKNVFSQHNGTHRLTLEMDHSWSLKYQRFTSSCRPEEQTIELLNSKIEALVRPHLQCPRQRSIQHTHDMNWFDTKMTLSTLCLETNVKWQSLLLFIPRSWPSKPSQTRHIYMTGKTCFGIQPPIVNWLTWGSIPNRHETNSPFQRQKDLFIAQVKQCVFLCNLGITDATHREWSKEKHWKKNVISFFACEFWHSLSGLATANSSMTCSLHIAQPTRWHELTGCCNCPAPIAICNTGEGFKLETRWLWFEQWMTIKKQWSVQKKCLFKLTWVKYTPLPIQWVTREHDLKDLNVFKRCRKVPLLKHRLSKFKSTRHSLKTKITVLN